MHVGFLFFFNDSVNERNLNQGILMVWCKTLPQGWSGLSIMERGGRRGTDGHKMMASTCMSRAAAPSQRPTDKPFYWLILSNVFSWVLVKPQQREPVRSKWIFAETRLTLRQHSSTSEWSCRFSGRALTWLTGSWQCPLGWAAERLHHLFAEEKKEKCFISPFFTA